MKIFTNEEITAKKEKKRRFLEKIKLILVIVITVGIFYNISLIIQSVLRPNKTPDFLQYKTFSIISGSMEPEIHVGDIVVVKEIKPELLRQGDIISFRENSEIITHRIYDTIEENGQRLYITKGDNNNSIDSERVNPKNIEGVVIKVIPKLGNVVLVLKNRVTILILVIIFILIYLADMKKNNKKMIREKKREILNKKREG